MCYLWGMIALCLNRPLVVLAACLLVVCGGLWALFDLPIQLTPDVEKPRITVRTSWPQASPYEVERELLYPQEQQLRDLPRLVEMNSDARVGRGNLELTFRIGTVLDHALLRITERLGRISDYPANALRPRVISAGSGASPVVWVQVLAREGNPRDIRTYRRFAEDVIRPDFERIQGVAEARVYGGREPVLKVRVVPELLQAQGISLGVLRQRIRDALGSHSAGTLEQGKNTQAVRVVSAFQQPQDLNRLVLKSDPSGVITLQDVAQVQLDYGESSSRVLSQDGAALIMPVYKSPQANVLEISESVRQRIAALNAGVLQTAQLEARVVSDPTYYIESAIALVLNNLYLGSLLALLALYAFLRRLRPALIVALTIPLCITGTLLALKLFGRSINVISLAGLAFAVGMVVDNAIVVLENIDRWRKQGKTDAALGATREVQTAIFAATLTTIVVFLPVMFTQDQAGQLFKDISIAISCAIALSLLVSISVVPSAYRLLVPRDVPAQRKRPLFALAGRISEALLRAVHWIQQYRWRQLAVVGAVSALAIWIALTLVPKLEYLPSGNRNLLLSILQPPPSFNTDSIEEVGQELIHSLQPLLAGEQPGLPRIDRLFFVSFGTTSLLGVVSADPQRVRELIPPVNRMIFSLPAISGFTIQTSLFERGLAAGRSIDVQIIGDELQTLATVASRGALLLRELIPDAQVRPLPSYELQVPELRVEPARVFARAAQVSVQELALALDVYSGGAKISEFALQDGARIDLRLESWPHIADPDTLMAQPLLAARAISQPVGSVSRISLINGPQQIRRIDGKRVFTLRVAPPADMPLESALEILQGELLPALTALGDDDAVARDDVPPDAVARDDVPPDARVTGAFTLRFAGTTDALHVTRDALQSGFLAALGLIFLLLLVLLADVFAPLVVLAALPVAAAGGVLALALVDALIVPQALDMLTLLGFLMLVGIVVNNPILIVSRALQLQRVEGLARSEAITQAVQTRLRPIFMTTCTSVLGLLPLVVLPGAGSELYRGLGAAVLGGLLTSSIASVFFVPSLYALFRRG